MTITQASDKLRVFLDGAEYQQLDELFRLGTVGDFRKLGETAAALTKSLARRVKELEHEKAEVEK